ncbi:MAG: carbamoyl-phosphate synthase large subunit [Vicinamibacterales bacterium]|jgi:carbamoyl-phosphate synthase large subunit|nr:carbamoyl phosphate synthase large subunit [Acidobacteriota bacterium]MDP7471829.1 carbamoyl-phosphate synthase large subunit [Vicinamibacterales bacterium]MDP7671441.1 carbamoyl-phosphate synthase large subunit [Vicinamibacterales bacterium]HJO38915.1 carbamoyl-phosphate synthase large subunit [Vicinamibacterales bacterium]
MPKRTDVKRVLVIGSGPIVIGQACEFDYSGTQACKALRAEGLEVVLVNSNPATIMTDPEVADRTYVEPLTPEVVTQIIERERPDALLPTVGGQTALNLAVALGESGVLEAHGVELIGASVEAIKVAEDRLQFREAMHSIDVAVPASAYVKTLDEALGAVETLGFPVIIRPSFTLGGVGGGIAYNVEEFREMAERGLGFSPVNEVLLEESVIGWKEFELEVMRDAADNFVVICSIENIDPMGVHTGDSVTVAPALTLTDKEYQRLRDIARRIIRRVGVETGGSNIQFAVHPEDGRVVAIEMNPRVSRSSALASKATGFPIAKIAAKLALGYHLDEIPNDITRLTPASFEPTIDYVVVKIPRWAFEKFPQADATLTTQMKSVGEVMAIGRTFKESFLKGFRSLELGRSGRLFAQPEGDSEDDATLQRHLAVPTDRRLWAVFRALQRGWSVEQVHEVTKIDRWFLRQFEDLVELGREAGLVGLRDMSVELLTTLKRAGFGDADIGAITGADAAAVLEQRREAGLRSVYKRIDTCAAEFESFTPYQYSTYERECEADPNDRPKVVILGSGPNRIGQGLEFDYCCCHAAFALREQGFETVMVNCNPETVSTDYDSVDRLYFEPLTFEDVLAIIERERSVGGEVSCLVQFGGQTPLKLALPLQDAGVNILGTSPDSIDLAEDRDRFSRLLWDLGVAQAPSGIATSREEARAVAATIGFPIVVRPSYVLGGRAMAIVYDLSALDRYITEAVDASPERPVLIDKFLEDAFELDVDAVADSTGAVVIGGIMEHIEEAGIHSGDSSCVVPPYLVPERHLAVIRDHTRRIARALNVIGLMNIQFAIKDDTVYVLEVNPRASRTVPYLSKATGVPLAKVAARVMAGATLKELELVDDLGVSGVFVKTPVFPFVRFPGVDTLLGPEMKSTGEVMGGAETFGAAFAKAQLAAGQRLPDKGTAFISVNDHDKANVGQIASDLAALGFSVVASRGTAAYLRAHGLDVEVVFKVNEGRPHIADQVLNGQIDIIINTPLGRESFFDDLTVRRVAMMHSVPCITTLTGAVAAVSAIKALRSQALDVRPLQDYHAEIATDGA